LKVPPEALLDGVPLCPVAGLAAGVELAALAITTELAPMKAPMAPPASVEAAAAAAIRALVRFMVLPPLVRFARCRAVDLKAAVAT